MIETAFVILHYNSIKDTLKCVESILKLKNQKVIGVVIVDNNSPNGSGISLQEKFSNNENVKILLNTTNEGFSKGNNIGYKYVIDNWNPRFIIIANNDIFFEQERMLQLIQEEYDRSKFDVLSVDVVHGSSGIHQSPLGELPTIKQVRKTILFNSIAVKYYKILSPFINFYFNRANNRKQRTGYEEYQEQVVPMGACIIFSEKYISDYETAFYPETNFYYEEQLLALKCRLDKRKIVYSPIIQVIHGESTATTSSNKKMSKRNLFRISNTLASASIFKDYLENSNEKS